MWYLGVALRVGMCYARAPKGGQEAKVDSPRLLSSKRIRYLDLGFRFVEV